MIAADAIEGIDDWLREAHATAVEKGWWDRPDGTRMHPGERSIGEQLSLFHSEISEALEEWREGHPLTEIRHTFKARPGRQHVPSMRAMTDRAPEIETRPGEWVPLTVTNADQMGFDAKPVGFPIELADLLIRVFDTAEAYGIDLEEALQIKAAYNRTRPHRHGGKLA